MTLIAHANLVDSINPAEAQLHALLQTAGIAPLDRTGWLRITGEDRVRWLNGMVTNSIQDLKPGQGNFNFVLSAQGRIQGTATAFAEPDSLLLQTDQTQLAPLSAILDRFIIMDDVELTDITSTWSGLSLIGPEAPALLRQLDLPAPPADAILLQKATWHSAEVTLIAASSPLVPRFELWADAAIIASLREALLTAGAVPCDPPALETLRILEGTPRYGTDIRDKELPQETAQPHALHFAKGCYLGQEIVERIRSRGNVHRTFTGFRLEGTLPAAGTPLEADGKPVGELTSVVAMRRSGEPLQLALGYIRREVVERAATVQYPGGLALPTSPPFRNI